MAYTPELSYESSRTLRRIAWSLKKPMTETLEWILHDVVKFLPGSAVCESCKDSSHCASCPFTK
jgi:hypothetical protein